MIDEGPFDLGSDSLTPDCGIMTRLLVLSLVDSLLILPANFTDSPFDNNADESCDSIELPLTKEKSKYSKRKSYVTKIHEYSQLVISCMRDHKRMNTTEVAKAILPKVRPKTSKLVSNWSFFDK